MHKPIVLFLAAACGLGAQVNAVVFSAAGANADAIRVTVDDFRAALGPLNAPGAAGDANGRREINWDGVPDQFATPNNMPPNFFNANSARGAVFSSSATGWTAFQVSANESAGPVRFDNVLQGYSSLFPTFSAQKLFTSIGTHIFDADFFVSGTETPGTVSGFGAVFANVALPFSNSIEFFTADGVPLGKYFVRPAPKGLSFLGVLFSGKVVAKVRVTPGTAAVGAADEPARGVNVVVLDDFIYGEPVNRCVVR